MRPAGAWQGEDSVAGSDDGGSQMADAARQKTWLTSNFREQAGDDDEGPSTLLDLSGSADGSGAGAMVDLDLDGLPDATGIDLDADADADGVDLEELTANV